MDKLKEIIRPIIREILQEASRGMDKQEIVDVIKQHPVTNKDIINAAKAVSKGRKAKIFPFLEPRDMDRVHATDYGDWATMQRRIAISLEDAGSGGTLPSGTYYSKGGLSLQFWIRASRKKGKWTFSINASKDTSSGMSVYKEVPLTKSSLKSYMKAIINDNKPNTFKDDIY